MCILKTRIIQAFATKKLLTSHQYIYIYIAHNNIKRLNHLRLADNNEH